MRYVIGIDGGGTKTMYALADEQGRLVMKFRNGCTNHDLSGMEQTVKRLLAGICFLAEHANIPLEQIGHVHMALAGIDTEKDRERLEAALRHTLLGAVPHTVENDLWIAFFAQTSEARGAISICGTGHNTGVLMSNGQRLCMRANRYPLGNFGGGRMLCDCALNAAFMSHEHTGDPTLLESHVAACCGCKTLDELAQRVMESGFTYQYGFELPRLLDELANDGDGVARDILADAGRIQAGMTGRMIKYAGMEHKSLPVVLAGSIYCKGTCQALVDAYRAEIHRYCPEARVMILDREPVEGAILCALRQLSSCLAYGDAERLTIRMREFQPPVWEGEKG